LNGSSLVLSPGFWKSSAWESRRAEETCTDHMTPWTLCPLSPETKTKTWAVLTTGSRCVGRPGHCRSVYPGALDLGISGPEEPADSCRAFARLRALTCAVCHWTEQCCMFVEGTTAWLKCRLQSWLETQTVESHK